MYHDDDDDDGGGGVDDDTEIFWKLWMAWSILITFPCFEFSLRMLEMILALNMVNPGALYAFPWCSMTLWCSMVKFEGSEGS